MSKQNELINSNNNIIKHPNKDVILMAQNPTDVFNYIRNVNEFMKKKKSTNDKDKIDTDERE